MNYIAYYRVSTQKQGNSGLGLQAQKSAVRNFLKGSEPVQEFMDIESGTRKGNNREALQQAIKMSADMNMTLVIAKLDRLARNVRFITTLMESSVEFIICDMPQANKFTIHIFAALAEQEAEMISQRTKAALKEAKARGVKLGKPENLTQKAITTGRQKRNQNALDNENNKKAGALIKALRQDGKSFYAICEALNNCGFKTRRGKQFFIPQVKRLYERYV
ncbi:recombinase family protein [Daejeonella sp. JGW-45]|uniref:recombinase family protein n=1 Tax=Daejeonella sp. JGW-45 TaxID=3034148 RepID=UPI0023EB88A0|nr:recombinase family protein [Daejeonella sp. JGW-45]